MKLCNKYSLRNSVCLLFIILLFCNTANARNYGDRYYANISIGPEVGGCTYLSLLKTGEGKFYQEYFVGGNLLLRPVEQFGIYSGFTYHKAINNYHYYSSPLVLLYTYKQKKTLLGGVLFNFDARGDKIDLKNPKLGGILGIQQGNILVAFTLNKNIPILKDTPITDIAMYIGIKVSINVQFGLIVSKRK